MSSNTTEPDFAAKLQEIHNKALKNDIDALLAIILKKAQTIHTIVTLSEVVEEAKILMPSMTSLASELAKHKIILAYKVDYECGDTYGDYSMWWTAVICMKPASSQDSAFRTSLANISTAGNVDPQVSGMSEHMIYRA
jgi:hypothetical protein